MAVTATTAPWFMYWCSADGVIVPPLGLTAVVKTYVVPPETGLIGTATSAQTHVVCAPTVVQLMVADGGLLRAGGADRVVLEEVSPRCPLALTVQRPLSA